MLNRAVPFVSLAVASLFVLVSATLAAPKIGFLTKSRSEFWAAAEAGAQRAGRELGAEVIAKSPLNEGDVSIQIQLLNSLVAQGVDAIVIAPSTKDTLAAPLAAAAAKGVKIVVFDTRLEGEQPYVFVGTDQRQSGRAAGELLASLLAAGDPVGFLKHNQTSGATIERESGAFERLRELRSDFTLAGSMYVGTERGAEKERTGAFFDQHPEVRAVLGSSTPATMALLAVVKERNLAGAVHCVGFGFNLSPTVAEAIETGVLEGWIAQLPGEMGYDAIKAAVALCNGEKVPRSINTKFFVVTKKNLQEPSIQALLQP